MLEVVYSDNESFNELEKTTQFVENKKMKLENVNNEMLNPHIQQTSFKHTEFDAFGWSVAAQLKSLPLIDALELQLQIQQLITEERLKRIRNELSNQHSTGGTNTTQYSNGEN